MQEGELLVLNHETMEVEKTMPLPNRPHSIAVAGQPTR
jgi:hypothetical protein